ncbi:MULTISPECIES: hypothetical protein [Acinetobacter calcoaceticus/baumannii complex]|uniref:hypothetical protein n=1 Tax=Acinetobacter calcoaceticus/baumannii complex TaxID=909768 RepID=UPI000A3AEDC4|nr:MULTISPECIES: hypothetical protein [Acinetobacter calcoaceticus/baumannii complex]MCZ1179475.1 hypothetical protein [Acinetobacter pittii]MDC4691683.1 hypothetical protein [Acinetobacter baumannii]MDH2468900.1 hypothetical protein [Acinetobacter baumannii]MDO7518429.1 hypothetical protein [Acinetobacter baumannii]MDV7542023.1 hypothetical protein [Acinetobacter baumannii]
MIISNHNDHIAGEYFNYLNKLAFFTIIPVTIGLFLAKNTGTDSFFIQKMAFSFLILSLFYLVTDSDRTIIAYNRIAKEYVKAYRGFLGHCTLIYKTFIFLLSFAFLGGIAIGFF